MLRLCGAAGTAAAATAVVGRAETVGRRVTTGVVKERGEGSEAGPAWLGRGCERV